jgi:hypothetical protein
MEKTLGDAREEFGVWCGPSALLGQRATREEARALMADIAAGRVRPDLSQSERDALNIRPIPVSGEYDGGSVTWVRKPKLPKPSRGEIEAFIEAHMGDPGGRDAVINAGKEYFRDNVTRKELLAARARVMARVRRAVAGARRENPAGGKRR